MVAKPTTPLFVRIPPSQARVRDRLAFETGRSKQAVVSELLARSIDQPTDRRTVLEPTGDLADRHTVVEPAGDPDDRRGRYACWPDEDRAAAERDVLTLEEVASMLRVEAGEVEALAGAGGLPGRRIGAHWRFSRAAILAWLSHGALPDLGDG